MARHHGTTRRFVVPALLVVLAVTAFLPHDVGWYAGLTDRVHRLVRLPVDPVSQMLASLGGLVRGPGQVAPDDRTLTDAQDRIDYLEAQYLALLQENRQLRRENAALQQLNQYLARFEHRALRAAVTARQADSNARLLTINRGRRAGLTEGLAVVQGGDVLGRTSSVGRLSSSVELVTSPSIALIQGIFVPQVIPPEGLSAARQETVTLHPSGPDELTELVKETVPVEVGDLFRLRDDTWPAASQAMIVGEVIAVEEVHEPVMRKRVVVRPRRAPLMQTGSVYVLVPQDPGSPAMEIPPQ